MQLPTIQSLLAAHPLPAAKALGQHFLLDSRITDRIAQAAGSLEGVSVIEIGPGPGGLTRSLLLAGAKEVVAVEKDARTLPLLQALQDASGGRLRVVQEDALKVEVTTLAPEPRQIVANLPYNVGTALLLQWLELIHADWQAFESLTLMFQKEVAERIAAKPGGKEYGRLSVLAQWLCEVECQFELPPGAFSPPPKVSSTVITLRPRQTRIAAEKAKLERVLAAAFTQRRKMLRSGLKPLGGEALLARAQIDPTRRAETLSVEEWCRVSGVL